MKLASTLRGTTVGALSLFAAGTIFPGAANADLALINVATNLPIDTPVAGCTTAIPPCSDSASASFVDLTAQGFGNNPRLLTMATNGIETGSGTPINVNNGDAIKNSGLNKTNTPTLAAVSWTSGDLVGIGLNSNQTGQTGITLQDMRLTLYNQTGATTFAEVGHFDLATAFKGFTFTAEDLKLQQGNGAAVFEFGLTADQQGTFNSLVATYGTGLFAGLSASLGCASSAPASCNPSNDGADSFIAFERVPGPVVGAGLPGLVAACGGLLGLARRRRQRHA
jgi:hypothetical protein